MDLKNLEGLDKGVEHAWREIRDKLLRVETPKVAQFSPVVPAAISDFKNPLIESVHDNLASEFYKRLVEEIEAFDKSLDEAHEVGVALVAFGPGFVFHLNKIGYWNPSLIRFYGTMDDGNRVKLIQHINQISVFLMKLPRTQPSAPKRPIGFIMDTQAD